MKSRCDKNENNYSVPHRLLTNKHSRTFPSHMIRKRSKLNEDIFSYCVLLNTLSDSMTETQSDPSSKKVCSRPSNTPILHAVLLRHILMFGPIPMYDPLTAGGDDALPPPPVVGNTTVNNNIDGGDDDDDHPNINEQTFENMNRAAL